MSNCSAKTIFCCPDTALTIDQCQCFHTDMEHISENNSYIVILDYHCWTSIAVVTHITHILLGFTALQLNIPLLLIFMVVSWYTIQFPLQILSNAIDFEFCETLKCSYGYLYILRN